jgi:hypothetical protein
VSVGVVVASLLPSVWIVCFCTLRAADGPRSPLERNSFHQSQLERQVPLAAAAALLPRSAGSGRFDLAT